MRKIIQVIKKNYKVLLRSNFSLFILLLGPIILTFLIGFFYFNSNAFAINLGLHSPDNSDFNLFFKSELENSKFSIFEYDSQLNCEDAIKSGLIHGCIFLPNEFTINDTSNNDLILKLDTSRGDIVAVIENLINNQITKISTQIQIQNTEKLLFIIDDSEQLINYTSQEIRKINQINADLKISNNNIKTQTTKFSTLFDTKALSVDELTSKYNGLNTSINTMTQDGLKALNTTETKLTQALQLLDEVNSSDSKIDDVDNLVSESKSQNSIGEQKFNSIKSSYYLNQLGKIVGGVEDKLISAAKSSGDISGDVSFDLSSNSKSLDSVSSILKNINNKGDIFKTSVSTLESKNAKTLMTPISVNTQNIVANSSVHLVSVFPSLIVGLIFIISLIMSSMFILTERKNKAHFRNFMSKNSASNFLFGNFISLSSIVFLQTGLIITLYHFWFLKSTDYIQFATLLAMVIPIISIFVLIGMFIGYLTKNESSNVILTFLVILGFLTLSGKILPLEALSSQVAQIAMKNPFLLGEGMIRKFLLFGVDISQMKSELFLILSYSGIFLLLNFIFESFSKKRFLYGLYAQIALGIKNSFLHHKVQTSPTSTLTSLLERAAETTQSAQTTNTNINSAPVKFSINKNRDENDTFELESLSDVNGKLKKL
jgi:hypothetical protein